MLRALLSILLLATALNIFAANPASPSSAPATTLAAIQEKAVQEDINKLQLEVGILASKMEAFDGKQANQIALLSNQSSFLGALIAVVSIVITLIAVWAGFFVHNRTEKVLADFEKDKQKFLRDAKQEAEAAIQLAKAEAEKQFKSHEDDLKNQLNDLIAEAQGKADRFDAYLQSKTQQIANLLLVKDAKATPEQLQELDLLARTTEQNAGQKTAKDLYIQALNDFARQHYQTALNAIEQALKPPFAAQGEDELNAKLLFAQAVCQQHLGKEVDAIKGYEALENRFDNSNNPHVQEIVAMGLINLGQLWIDKQSYQHALGVYKKLPMHLEKFDTIASPDIIAKTNYWHGMALMLQATSKEESNRLTLELAKNKFEYVIASDSQLKAEAYCLLGYIHWMLGDKEQAEKGVRNFQNEAGKFWLERVVVFTEHLSLEYWALLKNIWAETSSRT